ncbi:MAG TPA: DUF3084 domain-containing protein [Kamptonema sp.]|nr:DUF3084 domain-containing protein [Kamptonema sp.]
MTAGYILVIVMLILGGAIATLSDRLGTKVGKARLSLFKLRPRNTAVLVTVLTGTVLSATTLGILFAVSKPLRTGVFGIDEIQKRLNAARKDLNQTTQDKNEVEAELAKARAAQAQVRASLEEINRDLQAANAEQAQSQAKLNSLRGQLNRVEAAKSRTQEQLSRVEAARSSTESELNRTQSQLQTVSKQKRALGTEIAQLQREREELMAQGERVKAQIAKRDREIAQQDKDIAQQDRVIAQRNAEIAQRDRSLQDREAAIAERDRVIAQREVLLKNLGEQQAALEDQQVYLQQQVEILERDFQAIRSGTVAIRRGQILAAGVVRILEPTAAQQAVDRLLQEANRATVRLVQPGKPNGNEQVIDITKAEVEQLIFQIKDGQDYVVRILAGANYLQGEKRIQVFAEAEINRVVFRVGDVVAGTSLNSTNLTGEQVRQKLEKLIDACNFRAGFVGIVGGRIQIADDRIETLLAFIDRLQLYKKPLDVQAIAAEVTYTAGPLKINLVAIEDGVVIFSTGQLGLEKEKSELKINNNL